MQSKKSIAVLTEAVREIAESNLRSTGGVLTALRAIQLSLRCVPTYADEVIADVFNLTKAEVRGIVSFYSDLSRDPKALVLIRVCAAEACQAAGGRALQADVRAAVESNSLDVDNVAVEDVYCLGLCSVAPAAIVGDQLVGRADLSRVVALTKGTER